jgi:hypothetical protein
MRLVHTEEVTGSIPVSPTQLSGQSRSCNWPFFYPYNSEVQQRWLTAEPLPERLERIAGGG